MSRSSTFETSVVSNAASSLVRTSGSTHTTESYYVRVSLFSIGVQFFGVHARTSRARNAHGCSNFTNCKSCTFYGPIKLKQDQHVRSNLCAPSGIAGMVALKIVTTQLPAHLVPFSPLRPPTWRHLNTTYWCNQCLTGFMALKQFIVCLQIGLQKEKGSLRDLFLQQ